MIVKITITLSENVDYKNNRVIDNLLVKILEVTENHLIMVRDLGDSECEVKTVEASELSTDDHLILIGEEDEYKILNIENLKE